MVKTTAIPATAGASNQNLPAERCAILTSEEAYELGVRAFPDTIEFLETEPGGTYSRKFGVQNLRDHSITVIIPNVTHTTKDHYLCYPHYQLTIGGDGKTISDLGPGLERTATLVYTCTDSEQKNDVAKILIGEEFSINIPIVCSPVRPVLYAPSVISFGELPSDGTPIARRLTVENRGRREGRWDIEYSGTTRVAFEPSHGVMGPGQRQSIRVELIPETEGDISETARFVGQEMDPLEVRIVGHVTRSALHLLEPASRQPLRLVDFGAAYYGTRHQRRVVLHNAGVRPICYSVTWSPHQPGQEVAVDLTQCHLAAVADNRTEDVRVTGRCDPPELCFHVEPAFGKIAAKGEQLLTIDFTPRAYPPEKGFTSVYRSPPRRDYCLFLTIEPSIADLQQNLEFGRVYLGVRAMSLPVMFEFEPKQAHFPETRPGKRILMPCKLINQSKVLPLRFTFSDIAHFRASCNKGVLKPEETRTMHILCKPTQIGPLWRYIQLELLGVDTGVSASAETEPSSDTEPRLLVSARLRVSTYCAPITPQKKPLFVPGITPLWGHNEIGLNAESLQRPCTAAPVGTLAGVRTTKHRWVRWASVNQQERCFVALPNDRAGSIRPYHGPSPVRSIFTGQPRYTYLDPSYQYTADEWRHILLNEARYQEYIDRCHMERWLQQAELDRALYDGQEDDKLLNRTASQFLGAEFARLLRQWSTVCSRERRRLLRLQASGDGPPVPGLNVVEEDNLSSGHAGMEVLEKFDDKPKTMEIKKACERELTCVEIAKVKISNKLLNFGEVAQDVWACRTLDVWNPLDGHVLFRLHVDCRELENTSPTSAVVPPRSAVRLPVIFQCSTKREYRRVIKYSINGTCLDSVLVVATVVRMRLDISTTRLHFKCANLTSISPGVYQMVVVLRNSLNGVGEYRWRQEGGDPDDVFSLRPAHGVIDPYHSQRCVVTFRPSVRLRQPHTATFACHVTGGDTLTLALTSELGTPRLRLTDDRLQLENLPLYQVKRCQVRLYNASLVDAFFSLAEPRPMPGIVVFPSEGVVPAGGSVALHVTLVPVSLARFDCPVRLHVRDGQAVTLGISGRTEAPDLAADCGALYFGGVHCGSSASQVFHLENRSRIPATLSVDLRDHDEFSLAGPLEAGRDQAVQQEGDGRYLVRCGAGQTVAVSCRFAPRFLANHGFVLAPLLHAPPEVRELGMAGRPSVLTASKADRLAQPRRGGQAANRSEAVIALPSLKVIATALRQPVLLTPQTVRFSIGADLLERCFKVTKRVRITNNLNRTVRVVINAKSSACFRVGSAEAPPPRGLIERDLEVGAELKVPIVFTTSYLYPTHPTTVRAHLPVYVDTLDQPAVTVDIEAECRPTYLTASPRSIYLGAVPLGMTVNSELTIVGHDYQQPDELSVSISYVELQPSGTQDLPSITWRFPQSGRLVGGRAQQQVPLMVQFSAVRPVSVSARLLLTDRAGRSVSVLLLGAADNCLLTTYSFLSLHPEGYQEWLALQGTPLEVADEPDSGRQTGGPPALSAASLEHAAAAAVRSGSSVSSDQLEMDQLPMDVQLPSGSTTEFPRFPAAGPVQTFFQATYDAIEAWFINFGFPSGPFPYNLFLHLPECMGHEENSSRFSKEEKAQAQMWQTFGESVAYLSNKKIPNYNIEDNADSADGASTILFYIKRNRAVLDFLKKEGALLAHVRPEFMLRYEDFLILLQVVEEIQESVGSKLDMAFNGSSIEAGISAGNLPSKQSSLEDTSTAASLQDVARHLLDPNIVPIYGAFRDEGQFRDMAKAAWLDILLQTFRRFILQTVVKLSSVGFWPEMADSDARYMPRAIDPLESNIYSVPERLLLAWMTWSYNSQLRRLWDADGTEDRCITNFDTDLEDGVVLCSLFASHCPFLRDHLRQEVYAHPTTPEQAFHNCVIVAESCALLNLDTRLDPTSIMDANPVALLILVTVLYEKLPLYWPREAIQFRPELGSSQTRQLTMRNTSSRPVTYEVKLLGAEKGVFQVQGGGTEIIIGPRRTLDVTVQCSVHRIKQYAATLLLCPKSCQTPRPRPLVYPLAGGPLGAAAPAIVEVVSPLYSCRNVRVEMPNPLRESGDFEVRLTDKPQGERDLDTWLRSGVDAFPAMVLPQTVSLRARGKSRVDVEHMPWVARARDYYALFSNAKLGDFTVGCRDGPQSDLDEALQTAGPPPDGISAAWVMAADEVLCVHCHLLVDLSTKLRDFLEQCAPAWESEIERERRQLNGTAGTKSVPLCLSTSALEVGWHGADIVLRSPKYGDVVTARVAVLVTRPDPAADRRQ
ncbi:Cilia- and flagella-associated protein 47 [Amphibalanus amphitrite]|uniref:Cilia-and flagella-associated protein 47 n=1 Tax=Amphibalanus amphitrite TaxID=1232801 RepID=A0A6A4XAY0_AMPAM|nr:Cilia- and flagella-associated protein 47 [Amphibalanus amphitrite]